MLVSDVVEKETIKQHITTTKKIIAIIYFYCIISRNNFLKHLNGR